MMQDDSEFHIFQTLILSCKSMWADETSGNIPTVFHWPLLVPCNLPVVRAESYQRVYSTHYKSPRIDDIALFYESSILFSLCFCFFYCSLVAVTLPMVFRVTSLALKQSHYCLVSELTRKNVLNITHKSIEIDLGRPIHIGSLQDLMRVTSS